MISCILCLRIKNKYIYKKNKQWEKTEIENQCHF